MLKAFVDYGLRRPNKRRRPYGSPSEPSKNYRGVNL